MLAAGSCSVNNDIYELQLMLVGRLSDLANPKESRLNSTAGTHACLTAVHV